MLRNATRRLSPMKDTASYVITSYSAYSKKSGNSIESEQSAPYYTAKDIEFCPNRAKEVSQNYVKYAEQDICKDDPFIKGNQMNSEDTHTEQEQADAYQSFNNVSLHSVMQSNVPDPYSTKSKSPTHLNMPGSSSSQGYKYLSGKLQHTHHSKQK